MIAGEPSTGKSLILKYYPFFLNNYFNLSTNGISVSVAGLRGTRSSINLFGKEIKVVTIGHLGTFKTIHIDEAGENKELIQNLKTFLLEDNYSYDRAGSTGITNRRIAQVNISQNLDYEHIGQYRGAVRKAYKEMNVIIDGAELKEEWQEEWDLFLPIHQYSNVYLRKIVREKRLELKQKQTWWIDGLDYALHERFPFYFYLVNEQKCNELDRVIRDNSSRNTISENLELIRALYTEDLENFFKSLFEYQYSQEDVDAYIKVDDIISEYGFIFDTRTKIFYHMLVRFSRIINKRNNYEEMDFNLVRWYLEKTNCKLDVVDTNNYNIVGPANLKDKKDNELKEETAKESNSLFGLPDGDF
jgi:hypothetical protein